MTLHVYSARLTYGGPDRLDITRANVGRARKRGEPVPFGAAFAPSWEILRPALEARKAAKALEERAYSLTQSRLKREPLQEETDERCRLFAEAEAINAAAFEVYTPLFAAEMRASCKKNWQTHWKPLLRRERIVLCCACTDPTMCHRMLLRCKILPTFGAVDCGEVRE